jgi:hypothetical protein
MRTTTGFFLLLSVLLLNLSACKSDASSSKELQKTYFYPVNGTPYIYVFQDSLDPFFEMFERIVNYSDPLGKHVLIERYNANFNLVESYDLLADKDFQVFNHILYSGASQIIAQISDSTFMPWSGTGAFVSSFPGAVDSLYFSLKNKRSLNQEIGIFEWNGKSLSTRIFTDSIFSLAVDIKNKREKAVSAVAFHEFAEGLGRVRIRTADGKSNLVLKQILTEEDWKSLVTK